MPGNDFQPAASFPKTIFSLSLRYIPVSKYFFRDELFSLFNYVNDAHKVAFRGMQASMMMMIMMVMNDGDDRSQGVTVGGGSEAGPGETSGLQVSILDPLQAPQPHKP